MQTLGPILAHFRLFSAKQKFRGRKEGVNEADGLERGTR